MDEELYRWPGGVVLADRPGVFPVGTDAVLLADFTALRPHERLCDLGCGSGVLLLLLLARRPDACGVGVDRLPAAAELARENVARNGMTDRATVLEGDFRALSDVLEAGSFDLVVANPPYFPAGSGAVPPERERAEARTEDATLDELCQAAARLLRWGGRFTLCHRPERLADVLCALREHGMEPKRLRWVQHRTGSAPSLVLAEAYRGGKPGLRTMPPLILTNPDGTESAEVRRLYER